jgi:uncharacterized protein (TIGR02145 family)
MKAHFVNHLGWLILILLSISVFTSCKKDNSNPSQPTQENKPINGNIVAPGVTTANIEGWTVVSPFSKTNVVEGNYSLPDTSRNMSLIFVSDKNNEEKLLGLVYPGQTDFSINARSTVLAILMKMPPVASLSKEGQMKLLNAIKSDSKFNEAVQLFEAAFNQNKPLFDTSNVELNNTLVSLFESASSKRIAQTNFANVNIIRAGRNLVVQNPGKGIFQKVGLYKDGQLVNTYDLPRYQQYPSSIGEFIRAIGNPASPIEVPINLSGDGKFEVKTRTGKPFSGVSDDLAKQAFNENMQGEIYNIVSSFFDAKDCRTKIKQFIGSEIGSYTSLLSQQSGSSQLLVSVMTQVGVSTLSLIETSGECLSSQVQSGFIGKVKKIMKFINPISKLSGSLNSSFFIVTYFSSPASQDTCFLANGTNIGKCNECPSTVTDIDGNIYNVVSIGGQCWMKENLKTSRYRDGSNISYLAQEFPYNWSYATGGGYTIGKEAGYVATYGRLYNGYAIADARQVCPTGWHVPSDNEWATLELFLGGQSVAGGKLKSITGWQSPNSGATNESGFSGLPGGMAYDTVSVRTGQNGNWWSSSDNSIQLRHNNSSSFSGVGGLKTGLNVRCIKD